MSPFEAFKAAHAGEDFEDYAAFVKAMDEAGLEGEDRQKDLRAQARACASSAGDRVCARYTTRR